MMAAVLTIVLLAAPSEAVSRAHFAKAQKAFAAHDWRRALDEFTSAGEAAPDELPDLWFDIGQCHRNLGHPRLAVAAFERYLALKPDAADRERVRGLVVALGGRPATASASAAPEVTPPAEVPLLAAPPPAPISRRRSPLPRPSTPIQRRRRCRSWRASTSRRRRRSRTAAGSYGPASPSAWRSSPSVSGSASGSAPPRAAAAARP